MFNGLSLLGNIRSIHARITGGRPRFLELPPATETASRKPRWPADVHNIRVVLSRVRWKSGKAPDVSPWFSGQTTYVPMRWLLQSFVRVDGIHEIKRTRNVAQWSS
jgi:hypothetical protein